MASGGADQKLVGGGVAIVEVVVVGIASILWLNLRLSDEEVGGSGQVWGIARHSKLYGEWCGDRRRTRAWHVDLALLHVDLARPQLYKAERDQKVVQCRSACSICSCSGTTKVKEIKARQLGGENGLSSRKFMNMESSLACTLHYLFITTVDILLIVLLTKEIGHHRWRNGK